MITVTEQLKNVFEAKSSQGFSFLFLRWYGW